VVFSIVARASDIKERDLLPRYELAGEDASEKGVTLASCFMGNERREVLGGSDQWYCRRCKEHRDITKKIELYKVPRVMILQLKRFTSKKSANNKESGLFNLAYAQICQQEKVGEKVHFPVEGLDMRPYVLTLKNEA
jgi:ubiquitin C-terminal hydrolase